MERLTHEADFGLEDWEETLFFVKSDPNGAYNIIDIAKYQGEPEFDEILKNVALRLAAYENTGLEPEEIVKIREDIENGYMKSTARRYGVPVGRLRELVQADREGRIAVFPCKPSDVTVYQLRNKKHALGVGVHPRHVGCAKVWGNGKYELLHGGDVPCKDKDFGKTWFLKKDEAQAALEKMKEREEAYRKALQEILTAEQFAAFEKDEQARRERREAPRQRRPERPRDFPGEGEDDF